MSLLIVEDNPAMRRLLERTLEPVCRVQSASNAEDALAHAAETCFDVLLLDINLRASRDGVDLLRALRNLPEYQDTPALALTAYAMPGDREQLIKAGFDHYLSKPFTKEQLLVALRETRYNRELVHL